MINKHKIIVFLFSHDPHRNISFRMKNAALAKPDFFPAIAVRLVQCTCNISSPIITEMLRTEKEILLFECMVDKNLL